MRPHHTLIPALFSVAINSECAENQETIAASSASTPVQNDNSIRPFTIGGSSYCAYKRYLDYAVDHEVWLWPCDVGHSSLKYQWSHDETTGLIMSLGSEAKYPETPYCWYSAFKKCLYVFGAEYCNN